jgi:hypothetical protein
MAVLHAQVMNILSPVPVVTQQIAVMKMAETVLLFRILLVMPQREACNRPLAVLLTLYLDANQDCNGLGLLLHLVSPS